MGRSDEGREMIVAAIGDDADTGWTLDALRHIETMQVADSQILSRPMAPLTADVRITGTAQGSGGTTWWSSRT